MIVLLLGALAIFIWSQLAPKEPTPKTEVLESPLPEPKDIMDVFKENAPKVAAIVGGGGAAVAAGGGAAAAGAGIAAAAVVPAVALPAAAVIPAGLSAMAPTTLSSAVFVPTAAPVAAAGGGAAVPTATAPVAGGTTLAQTLGGAALVVSPLIIMPVVAKALDWIFGTGKSGLYDNPELVKEQERITAEKEALIASYVPGGAVPVWDPKTGFVDDPDNPSAFPGGK